MWRRKNHKSVDARTVRYNEVTLRCGGDGGGVGGYVVVLLLLAARVADGSVSGGDSAVELNSEGR